MQYYTSIEECTHHFKHRKNTNPRYPNYCQSLFTAGDAQQFYTSFTPLASPVEEAVLDKDFWKKFHRLDAESVSNTFRYMFHKFKKGVFVQIANGRVQTRLPFSKHHYINEWSARVQMDVSVFERANRIESRPFHAKHVNRHMDQWYANNALIRYEFPLHENDTGISTLLDMLDEVCKAYPEEIPDMEFFLNKRDHPLLRVDGCEPYDYIYGESEPLVSHDYPTYAPILSMCGGDAFADILIPTWEDWARVCMLEGKYFPKHAQFFRTVPFEFCMDWSSKKPIALFRGSSTGFGTTLGTNMRLKLALLSQQRPDIVDAGITQWNARPRICKETHTLKTFDDDVMQLPLVPYMEVEEQSRYKYLLNVDGHVTAFRLSLELGMGSVVLLVRSRYKIWFSDMLQPYVHYVPVEADLSDLITQIEWCRTHDAECRQIAENALTFYRTVLSKEGMLRYLKELFVRLKRHTGQCRYISSPYTYLHRVVEVPQPALTFREGDAILPPYGRTFDTLQGVQWYLSHLSMDKWSCERDISYNRESALKVYTYKQLKLLSKTSPEAQNDAMIGLHCINPLLRDIPNFAYTYFYREGTMYMEYIEDAISFFEYLRQDSLNIHEYCGLMVQIAMALHTAQQACLFMHYDLYPWNILIRRLPEPVDVYYLIDAKQVQYMKVRTRLLPILIDYGKSSGVVQNTYYGHTTPFEFQPVHDILCLLISSLHILVQYQNMDKKQLRVVFQCTEFFSGTRFSDNTTFKTIKELKYFLSVHKKYSVLLEKPKYELAEKTPLDFVRFMASHSLYRIQHGFSQQWTMRCMTGHHAFEYLCASTDEERAESWRHVLDRIVHSQLEEHNKHSYYSFLRILEDIQRYTSLSTEQAREHLSPLLYSVDHPIPTHLHALPPLTESLFPNPEHMETYRTLLQQPPTDSQLVYTKQFILQYLVNKLNHSESIQDELPLYIELLSIDNISALQSIARRHTFDFLSSFYPY